MGGAQAPHPARRTPGLSRPVVFAASAQLGAKVAEALANGTTSGGLGSGQPGAHRRRAIDVSWFQKTAETFIKWFAPSLRIRSTIIGEGTVL